MVKMVLRCLFANGRLGEEYTDVDRTFKDQIPFWNEQVFVNKHFPGDIGLFSEHTFLEG